MKGNYIGKKSSGYSAVSAPKTGMWEIYDQGQMVRDTQWTGQPWEVNNGYYLNKKWTVGLNEPLPSDVQFNDDGTKLYIIGSSADTIYQYACSTAWDVSTASYTNKSFSVNTQESTPNGLFFKSDGTKFYIVGTVTDTIYQYSCATAWDISTGYYDNKAFSVTAQEGNPLGLFFKTDGTKFYIVGLTNARVYQYSCATAWDVSTGSYDNKSFLVSSQETQPVGLFFKSDGTKFYVIGQSTDAVYQYSCATTWDVSTGSYDTKFCRLSGIEGASTGLCFKSDGTKLYVIGTTLQSVIEFTLSTAWDVSTNNGAGGVFYVGGQETSTQDVHFKSDGTKFYVIGTNNDSIYQYSCATAWDVSTASYDSKSFSVAGQETVPNGLFFKPDGTSFYIIGFTNDTVYQYTCATAWDVSTASYASKSFSVALQEASPHTLFFKSDGTQFYILGQANDTIYQYSCGTAWDVSTASYASKSFSVNAQESTPYGLFFKSDGAKFYVVGLSGNVIYQYSCATAWDISTGSYDNRLFNIATQSSFTTGLFFKSDGTRLYVIGNTSSVVFQYDLPLAWDVVNAGFGIKAFAVNLQDTNPNDLTFSSDGTKLYVIGDTNDAVYQYTCSTAWDINTAVFNYNSSGAYGRARIGAQESVARGLFFKPDGTTFYIVGTTNDTVYQYTCATAWDVSTASYASKSFSVAGQETALNGLFFKSDGTKFYIIGAANNTVYQYSCATAWDVSTASYDSKSFSVALQGQTSAGVAIDNLGIFLYMCNTTTPQGVYQYSLV